MFSVHDLTTFIAVAESGSVRGAALVINRTQPAVSQSIRRLEEHLGFALFDRSGYRLSLTAQGDCFLQRARPLVQQMNELKRYANSLSEEHEARLRMVVHGPIPQAAVAALIEHLPTQFPDVTLELQVCDGNRVLAPLVAGEAELAFAIKSPVDHLAREVARVALGEVEFVHVVRADRLSGAAKEGHQEPGNLPEGLAGLPQIRIVDFGDPEPAFGVAKGHSYWCVSDHRAKAQLILSGFGWGSLPRWMVAGELASGELVAFDYQGFPARSRHPFYLWRHQEKSLGPVARSIWNAGLQLASGLGEPLL
ncbi:LysR family transcriptional regulator [Halioxenophilus sp. WMMB6]|uniref:LysR family transcriptional regulator n=1 Tax=Halioxenophilus sp. WMMB6 TaxID=3073815 RepID=UPI00295E2122|nr:LysR family transcriptional regulator [Halioxenophilus sp. WMMB6]